jgi:hypothetical protein
MTMGMTQEAEVIAAPEAMMMVGAAVEKMIDKKTCGGYTASASFLPRHTTSTFELLYKPTSKSGFLVRITDIPAPLCIACKML